MTLPHSTPLSPTDWIHLRRATELGEQGWGRVRPNPMVGCVIVRDGEVVAEGFHEAFGDAHAEVRALESAGEHARGATVYVSLEPCGHHGKTPPCTDALIAAEVGRVVFGAVDPGPRSSGGAAKLRAAGVEVSGPAYDGEEARRWNPSFFATAEGRAPWIVAKLAVSADGFISARRGERTQVSSAESMDEVHRLRSGFDSILIGGATARVDDPRLTVRTDPPPERQPVRVVLSPRGRLARNPALVEDLDVAPLWVFVQERVSEASRLHLESVGAEVVTVSGLGTDESLAQVVDVLRSSGHRSVLVEGGGRLIASFLRARLLDRLYLFQSPDRLGGAGVPAFPGLAGHALWEEWRPIGPDRPFGIDRLTILDRRDSNEGAA